MFEAMNAVEAQYENYLPEPILVPGIVSAESAGISAAYQVARSLYPQSRERSVWEATLFETMATISEGVPKQAGIVLGQLVANRILASRDNDGSNAAEVYSSSGLPGGWERTAPDFLPPLLPHWGQVRPMAVSDILDYQPGPPPDLSSAQFAAAIDEVMRLGRVDSSERSEEQTEIALFWADGGGTATPPGHWNRIASQISVTKQVSSLDRARTFSLLNLALADAGIASWNAKYHYDFWRPIDAIRKADRDGNEQTIGDATWLPMLRTPPFPSYTSGHSTFSSAAATVLTKVYGDNYSFASRSDALSGLTQKPLEQIVKRQFASFIEAAEEAGQSRIYGGIHFQFDNSAGWSTGQSIGDYVVNNLLRPQIKL
jgi:membrane-associated phospholipid phosphatase